jgi:hypothetical protein
MAYIKVIDLYKLHIQEHIFNNNNNNNDDEDDDDDNDDKNNNYNNYNNSKNYYGLSCWPILVS